MRSTFLLFYQEHPHISTPFRIAEVYMTSEGYRTRLTSHNFDSREKAMGCIKILTDRMEGKN